MRQISYLIITLSLAAYVLGCNNSQDTRQDFVKTTQFMINGVADKSVAHKAVVGLYIRGANKACNAGDGISCTGTLIHPQYVLTAAHCVSDVSDFGHPTPSACNPFFHIGIGNNKEEAAANLYDIQDIHFSNDYNSVGIDANYATIDSDIALIKLKQSVPNSVAKPILTMPPWLALSNDDLGSSGRDMEFSGFGYDEDGDSGNKSKFTGKATLYCGASNPSDAETGCRIGAVKVNGCHPNPDICQDNGPIYNETDYVHIPYGSFYYSQIDGGPCQGDSGGPGFVTIGGVEYVASVTSYGDSICAAYGVSTATQDFYDWIIGLAPEIARAYVEICDNGIDDNGNDQIDCEDTACYDTPKCDGSVKEICDNDIDDNDNGKIDCADPACADAANCIAVSTEICDNGKDDDDNGLADCDDPACKDEANCKDTATDICEKDKDGNIDCSDPTCQLELECIVTELADSCSSSTKTPASNPLNTLILSIMGLFGIMAVRRTQSRKLQS